MLEKRRFTGIAYNMAPERNQREVLICIDSRKYLIRSRGII